MKQFVDYVLGFYGESGLYDMKATREEVWHATCIYLRRLANNPDSMSFEGDSIDREAVRDIILDLRAHS